MFYTLKLSAPCLCKFRTCRTLVILWFAIVGPVCLHTSEFVGALCFCALEVLECSVRIRVELLGTCGLHALNLLDLCFFISFKLLDSWFFLFEICWHLVFYKLKFIDHWNQLTFSSVESSWFVIDICLGPVLLVFETVGIQCSVLVATTWTSQGSWKHWEAWCFVSCCRTYFLSAISGTLRVAIDAARDCRNVCNLSFRVLVAFDVGGVCVCDPSVAAHMVISLYPCVYVFIYVCANNSKWWRS